MRIFEVKFSSLTKMFFFVLVLFTLGHLIFTYLLLYVLYQYAYDFYNKFSYLLNYPSGLSVRLAALATLSAIKRVAFLMRKKTSKQNISRRTQAQKFI